MMFLKMFSQLFSGGSAPEVPTKPKPAKAAKPKAPPKAKASPKPKKPRKPKGPVPNEVERTHASGPFSETRDATPEPAPTKTTLEYDDVSNDGDAPPPPLDETDWTVSESGSVNSDDDEGYDASSMAMSEESHMCGSLGSNAASPSFLAGLGSSEGVRAIEKKRPPGISVTFDDDSWID
jgi:hypothetical protein